MVFHDIVEKHSNSVIENNERQWDGGLLETGVKEDNRREFVNERELVETESCNTDKQQGQTDKQVDSSASNGFTISNQVHVDETIKEVFPQGFGNGSHMGCFVCHNTMELGLSFLMQTYRLLTPLVGPTVNILGENPFVQHF